MFLSILVGVVLLIVASLMRSDSGVSLGKMETSVCAGLSSAHETKDASVNEVSASVKEVSDCSSFLGVVNAGLRNGGATTWGASWGVKNDRVGGFDEGVPKTEYEAVGGVVDGLRVEPPNTAYHITVSFCRFNQFADPDSPGASTYNYLIVSWPPGQTDWSDRQAQSFGTPTP